VVLVMCGLHVILSLEKTFPHLGQELVALHQLLIDSGDPGEAWRVGHQRGRVTTIDHPERR